MSENVVDQLDSDLEPQIKMAPYAIRYGIIAGLIACVYSLIVYFADQEYNQILQWVGLIIPIVFVVMTMKAYKKDNLNRLRGGQGFKLGMFFFLIYAVVVVLYSLLYIGVINPEYADGLMDNTIDKLEDRGLSDEMIDQQMAITKMFMTTPAMMAMSFVMSMITGAIISGISAAIIKSPKN